MTVKINNNDNYIGIRFESSKKDGLKLQVPIFLINGEPTTIYDTIGSVRKIGDKYVWEQSASRNFKDYTLLDPPTGVCEDIFTAVNLLTECLPARVDKNLKVKI